MMSSTYSVSPIGDSVARPQSSGSGKTGRSSSVGWAPYSGTYGFAPLMSCATSTPARSASAASPCSGASGQSTWSSESTIGSRIRAMRSMCSRPMSSLSAQRITRRSRSTPSADGSGVTAAPVTEATAGMPATTRAAAFFSPSTRTIGCSAGQVARRSVPNSGSAPTGVPLSPQEPSGLRHENFLPVGVSWRMCSATS